LVPGDRGGPNGVLSDVSCVQGGCIAVGHADGTYPLESTLAERFDGSSWSTMITPSPNAQGDGLSGVSCAAADDCTAVGDGNGTLVEHWDGSDWSVEPSPSPNHGGSEIPQLTAVSCTEAAACVALGSDDDGNLLVEQDVSGPATALSISPASRTLVADGISTDVITATVTDAYGSRLAGESVALSSSDPGEKIGPVTDNQDGTYTATLTSSTSPGKVTITATDATGTALSTATVIQQVAPAQPGSSTLPPKPGRTVPRVARIRLSQLRTGAHGVTTFYITVAGPGVMRLAETTRRTHISSSLGGNRSTARGMVISRGRITLHRAGKFRIKLVLNSAGRRLAHGPKRLWRVELSGTYTSPGASPTTISRRLTFRTR
ncbi:MAG: invasin domain 3-containing protein, partial [Solirubrobacteraceae bacterium]